MKLNQNQKTEIFFITLAIIIIIGLFLLSGCGESDNQGEIQEVYAYACSEYTLKQECYATIVKLDSGEIVSLTGDLGVPGDKIYFNN